MLRTIGLLRCANAGRGRASARLRAMASHPSALRWQPDCPRCGRSRSACPGCERRSDP